MTQPRTIEVQYTLANLNRALVGFDHVFNARLANNYPPHNIVLQLAIYQQKSSQKNSTRRCNF